MAMQQPVIRELTNRIEILEREVRSLRLSLVRKGMLEEKEIVQVSPPDMRQVLAELRQEGLIRDPALEELEHAAAWDALPEAEKRRIDEELVTLHLDPLLSEIIDLNRAGKVVEL
ncbi:MAG: hypothetical protein FJ014_03090 [Chloroflexi bacterium]|nr:hypothetical protein [Chloroflexota bacterium]